MIPGNRCFKQNGAKSFRAMIALEDKVEIVTQALPYPKEELFYI